MKTCWFEMLGSGVVNHFVSEALFSDQLVASSLVGIDTFDAKCRQGRLPSSLTGSAAMRAVPKPFVYGIGYRRF